jgi:hypothetical protein
MNISFRVWDEITRSYSGGDLWSINASGELYYGNAIWTDGVVELFTEMLDKNKVKIFVGDIVRYKRQYINCNNEIYIQCFDSEIKFKTDGFLVNGTVDIIEYESEITEDMFPDFELEVIGNIHEGIK